MNSSNNCLLRNKDRFYIRERPLLAAPLGAAAALLRPNGLLIALPLAWLARGRDWRYKLAAAAPVAEAVAVELIFWRRRGHVDAFFHAQRPWGRHGPTAIGPSAHHVRDRADAHLAPV